MADSHAPTERFGDRADAYVRHRPGCPAALFARHAVDGAVDLDYDTRAFVGTLH